MPGRERRWLLLPCLRFSLRLASNGRKSVGVCWLLPPSSRRPDRWMPVSEVQKTEAGAKDQTAFGAFPIMGHHRRGLDASNPAGSVFSAAAAVSRGQVSPARSEQGA